MRNLQYRTSHDKWVGPQLQNLRKSVLTVNQDFESEMLFFLFDNALLKP